MSLVDFTNGGSVALIAESFPTRKISVSMELGTYYSLAGYGMKKLHGWRSGFEMRYYFNENKTWDYFFGVRYFYKKIGFDVTDSVKLDSIPYAKTHLDHKEVNVIDLIFGTRNFSPGKKFEHEFYFGIGIRFKNTTTFGLTPDEVDNRVYGNSLFLPLIMQSGNSVHLDLLFGIKIGIGVKKRQRKIL